RTTDVAHTGNYSFQLQPQMWVEQEFQSIDVNKIYENYTLTFWASRGTAQNTYLNFSFQFTDSTFSTYWIYVNSLSFRKYSFQFNENDRNKSFTSLHITNENSSVVYLDNIELYYSYSDKPPGVSLLAVPIYWVGDIIATQILGMSKLDIYVCLTCDYEYDEEAEGVKFEDLPDDWVCPDCGAPKEDFARSEVGWHKIDDLIKFVTMLCVLIFGAFTVLKLYDFLRFEGISHSNSHRVSLLFGLGSLFYVYIGTFFSHSITAGLLLLALYQGSIFRKKRTYNSLLWASILSGFMVVCDYIFLFFLPFFYLYLFIPIIWNPSTVKNFWRDYVRYYLITNIIFLIPMILCGLLVTYYNYLCFGDPFVTPYSFARFFQDVQHFAAPMMDGLEILLLSTHHGLLIFMPIVIISILGIIPMYRKNPALAVMCLTAPFMLIFLYSKYYLPTGGLAYGPRQLVPIVPFLVIPLAFLLDQKIPRNLSSSILQSFNYVFLFFLKICAGILGIITFLINFAGGWVGVYPLGGQDMIDPIWGTADQVGHLDTLFSWINFSLDLNGKLSLDILQGHYMGEIHIDLVLASFTLNIHWPAASSLALHEVSAFAAILFLILLINPYLPLTNLIPYLRKKIHPYIKNNENSNFYRLIQFSGMIILGLFVIWIIEGFFSTLGVPVSETVVDYWNRLITINDTLGKIPLINIIGDTFFFVLFFLMNIILLRPPFLSIQRWMFNSLLFLVGTAILTIADEHIRSSNLEIKTDQDRWNRKYFFANRILSILYIGESLITIIFFNSGSSIYSDFLIIILVIIFIIITNSVVFPLLDDPASNKNETKDSEVVQLHKEDYRIAINYFERMFAIGVTSVSSIITGLLIISQIIVFNVPLTDFFFIRPFTNLLSIREWFFKGQNSVPVYLTLFLLLQLIILILLIINNKPKEDQSNKIIPFISQEEIKWTDQDRKAISGFQSILLFGGWLVFFFHLLITVLYSALSSVPDPSSLLTYSEESDLFLIILLVFILALLYTGANIWRNNLQKYLKKLINTISGKEVKKGGA
ncbi:MAG: rubredoxin, partial [Candidatus Hodarchaeales archaeon]